MNFVNKDHVRSRFRAIANTYFAVGCSNLVSRAYNAGTLGVLVAELVVA